jgi:hypothetical protein
MIRGGQILNRQRQRDSQGKRSLSAEEFVGATVMSTHLARAGQFGYGGQFTTKVGSMMASVKEAHTGQVLPVDLTFPPVLYNKVSLVECLVACVSRVMVVLLLISGKNQINIRDGSKFGVGIFLYARFSPSPSWR